MVYVRRLILILAVSFLGACQAPEKPEMVEWGRQKLDQSLKKLKDKNDRLSVSIDIGYHTSGGPGQGEGFEITVNKNALSVMGEGPAGAMYGALRLAEELERLGELPDSLGYHENPQLKLRATGILLMKQGRYNFPVTPEEFPFFYDRAQWIEYLDFLAVNRFNAIVLWNGHPFAYFVKLERYPEAQSGMDPGLLQKNHDMLQWLIGEGLKRNIRFIFEFYNIHTSVYYQKAHDLPNEISDPTPELEAYTTYCIREFLKAFPEIGLYITPGEALKPSYAPYWLNEVLFPAVLGTGRTPPVVVRAWGIELAQGEAMVGYYPDLFFERKFNVEMIADTRIDPKNKLWAALTGNFMVNIHCVANLEPFRWNPPAYIQHIMQSSIRAGSNGLHLYPRKAWRWPDGCEIGSDQPQWERDELWFRMWGRYAWNSDRDAAAENDFWMNFLRDRYGDTEAARLVLIAFEAGADVLPALQRLLWVGNDNHTVVTAGIRLDDFWTAGGIPFLSIDPVERIPAFFERIRKGLPSSGTDPIAFLKEKLSEAQVAFEHVQEARKLADKNMEELERLEVDARAVILTTRFYLEKLQAASILARYNEKLSDPLQRRKFLKNLEASVNTFRELAELTAVYYESISDVPAWTPDRLKKVPYHWQDILPLYEVEYEVYQDEFSQAAQQGYYDPSLPGLAGIWYGDPGLLNIKGPDPVSALDLDWSAEGDRRESKWSAEWFGYIRAANTGNAVFKIATVQEAILEIDHRYSAAFHPGDDETNLIIPMKAGNLYPIHLIYNNYGGDTAYLKVFVIKNGKPEPISAGDLFHSPADQAKMGRILKLRAARKY